MILACEEHAFHKLHEYNETDIILSVKSTLATASSVILTHYPSITFIVLFRLESPLFLKVTAMSLKLEIRLHAHPVDKNTRLGAEAIFTLT